DARVLGKLADHLHAAGGVDRALVPAAAARLAPHYTLAVTGVDAAAAEARQEFSTTAVAHPDAVLVDTPAASFTAGDLGQLPEHAHAASGVDRAALDGFVGGFAPHHALAVAARGFLGSHGRRSRQRSDRQCNDVQRNDPQVPPRRHPAYHHPPLCGCC